MRSCKQLSNSLYQHVPLSTAVVVLGLNRSLFQLLLLLVVVLIQAGVWCTVTCTHQPPVRGFAVVF
jgi:hypothetical protein